MTGLRDPLSIGGRRVRNRVFLAPMSGITDEPFRARAHQHGAGLVVSEMIASGELAKGREGSRQRVGRAGADIHMVQLAGCRADLLAEAARIVEGEGADIVDINMGCPAKKVIGGYAGSALMRDLDQAERLIDAVIAAVKVPVTVKMRLGWDDDSRNAPLLALRAEGAGVAMVTVHGRTRCQFYEGSADWQAIAAVKQAVSMPVVANGDVKTPADAARILALSGADAVMVGRGSLGAPWLPAALAADGEPGADPERDHRPTNLGDYVVAHYDDMLSHYGTERGLRHARKHLGWYLDRLAPGFDAEGRAMLMRSLNPSEVKTILVNAFDGSCALRNAA